ncbi:pentatricopeptide repeat-containing protein At1g09410, mitochondrial-like [Benincasa hispida]|uniref:pentatricopeptide repeat-containing protein At1g09410, mitochondrial-like n=1 Tax=Benincasa hispida TaxID=102211 RepID=UPI0019007152|nr:pentatricopeptide repeat-containing protein At1g09410, mitochondrial-like [Benincasa hispida]
MKFNVKSIGEKGSYVFTQNLRISQLGKSGRIEEAVAVFSQMTEKNIVTYNSMISAYAKNGRIENARELFDLMPQRNLVSWNSMIAGYLHNELVEDAAKLFDKMFKRDLYSWTLMITCYTRIGELEKAKELFNLLPDKQDTVCCNALIAGYAKKRRFDEAKKLFDEMLVKNIVSWNSMLSGYTKNGEMQLGLQFFEAMGERNVVSWNLMVDGYIGVGDLDSAWMIFKKIPTPNVVSWVTMFSGFAHYGRITEARSLFDEIPSKNLVSWNAMIGAYVRHNQIDDAYKLFMEMPEKDSVSYTTMINGYVRVGKLSQAREILNLMPYKNIAAQTAMINGYVQSSRVDEANEIFSQISVRDSVCWNTMITGYTHCGRMDEALCLFQDMACKDMVSWNTMIAGYAQSGQMVKALGIFNEMQERNIVSWNSLITGYVQNGLYFEALNCFILMKQQGEKPDQSTFVCCLRASANLAALNIGIQLHHLVIKTGFGIDLFVKNAIMTMYAKSGRVLEAENVFAETNNKDVVSWNSLIAGYALNGCGKEALGLFEEMSIRGIIPDEVTFTGLLSACNHGGLVDQGLSLFKCMTETYSIKPSSEHYACVVDLLGRVGRLEEAMEIVEGMKTMSSAKIWGALLWGCRKHQNLELAKYTAERLLALEPQNASNYVLLSNMHAEAGRWDMVERVRVLMKENKAEKQPGCSWIEIDYQVHCFLSEAPPGLRLEICNILKTVTAQIRNTEWMLDYRYILDIL